MIIEAGYDIHQILHGEIFSGGVLAQGLWVMGMDENLRLLFTRKVSGQAIGSIEEHPDDLLAALTDSPATVRYYALAYSVDRLPEHHELCPYHDDEPLLEVPALKPYELLGRVVYDDGSMCSTVPRCSFRDYPSLAHLPRTGVVLGPHDADCTCFACTQHREMLRRNWQGHHSINSAVPPVNENDSDD
ncbi:hypothetical protein [Lacisediminihabitans sp.]|jgi:hypothetical protein|uniref:hypothetical protein n=1 Tax=Lacisediminihabitans sp. TaxID=2787631 RepID=UPI002F928BB4